MFTSRSEQSTPPELSMASVFTLPPASANSIRPRWVTPRLPPSPSTLARSSEPSTRTPSFALSPASAWLSDCAFTYVPMPPFQRSSTGARRSAWISSLGFSDSSSIPSASRASGETGIDLAVRSYTPPPAEMASRS